MRQVRPGGGLASALKSVILGAAHHLWQSTLFCAAVWLLTILTSRNAAVVRLWLWRIAAAKFLVPFWILYFIGVWMGFSSPEMADDTPSMILAAIRVFSPVVSPELPLATLLALVCLSTPACLWLIDRNLRVERHRARREQAMEHEAPSVGFSKAAMITMCALSTLSGPLIAGALDAERDRRELLAINTEALYFAEIAIAPARPGMGQRQRIDSGERTVLIRNTSLRDLIALAYGLDRWRVLSREEWLDTPRYDVFVSSTRPIARPERLELSALRAPVTKLLADRFSLEIYLNERCQPPCGRYAVPMPGPPTARLPAR
jgi:hypothetical protein